MERPFDSLYSHGFVRVGVAIPEVRPAHPRFNTERTLRLAERGAQAHALIQIFPELGLSGYSNEDLFHQEVLLQGALEGLGEVVRHSAGLPSLLVVGVPLRLNGGLYNCAAIVHRGRLLGLAPKSFLPNYREFYEKRQFCAAGQAAFTEVDLLGQRVPFGADLVFTATNLSGLACFAEVCEDVWAPVPPSTWAALGGATVLANLSASNITIGKADYRRQLAASQSGRCLAAYCYSAAGGGESSTDLAWDGHGMIWENGTLLAETERFSDTEQLITADIDLDRLSQERMRVTSFLDAIPADKERVAALRRIPFEADLPTVTVPLQRRVERFPFVPSEATVRDRRCEEAYQIQVGALAKRLRSSGLQKLVIGISGGLDSTQALLVAARTMDRLDLPRTGILAFTMPGFATSERTHANAVALMKALGVTTGEIDIRPSCLQMMRDLGHPFADGKPVYDVTFENVQAGERTSHLFRLANQRGGLVLGTGDLSELALGWCTYGVGDHMSHYNVNASVPKTLIQYLIRWVADSGQFGGETGAVLRSILETGISPELIPGGADGGDHTPHQQTEATIGPYELQDFHLYYLTRFGFRPSKVAFLCHHAWADPHAGTWPSTMPANGHRAYDLATIRRWLRVFLTRFFGQSQFKRTCVPNGPKVGSGGSLSPRGDWRAPSDAEATAWLEELDANVPR